MSRCSSSWAMTPSYRFGLLGVVADAVHPVERVDHDDVHAGVVDVLGREVPGGVRVDGAVVVRLVLHVVDEHHQGVAARPIGADRRADVAEVRLVDGDDVVCELVAERVDLLLRDEVVGSGALSARCELVIRVLVERRIEAGNPFGAPDATLRDVDVDGRPVGGRVGVGLLEDLVVRPARLAVVEVDEHRRIARFAHGVGGSGRSKCSEARHEGRHHDTYRELAHIRSPCFDHLTVELPAWTWGEWPHTQRVAGLVTSAAMTSSPPPTEAGVVSVA